MIIIRQEQPADFAQSENVVREAFWNVYRPGCHEHFVLHQLRKQDCFVNDLTFVCEIDNKIVGVIAYSKGKLKTTTTTFDVLTFGPLAVLPEYQKQGYGKSLVLATMSFARERGYPIVLICGDQNYYAKFGFEPAQKLGITLANTSGETPFFLARKLDLDFDVQGEFTNPECFFATDEQVDEFDKNFPEKQKLKTSTQLF